MEIGRGSSVTKMAKTISASNPMIMMEDFYETNPFFYDKSGTYWIWEIAEHKYVRFDETDILNAIDDAYAVPGLIGSKEKNEFLQATRMVGRKHIPIVPPVSWIQFKGKVFDIITKKKFIASPDYFFCNPLPWELGTDDKTPIIDRLFTEWVGQERVNELKQIIAYCCYRDYPIHLLFCLVGSGNNGKSCFQRILLNVVGKDNSCATELDLLTDNRFETYKTYKKLVCIMGETGFQSLQRTDKIKKLTGQDLISYEAKYSREAVDEYSYCKPIINSNSLPPSEDTTDGFYRRWHIVNFQNSFKEGTDIVKTIPKEEYNALCSQICDILPALIEKGGFDNQGSIEDRKNKYIAASNPLTMFIDLTCNKGPELYCKYGELYALYSKYLNVRKKRASGFKEFNASLAAEGYEVDKTSKKALNALGVPIKDENSYEKYENTRWVIGLKLKDSYMKMLELVTVSTVVTGFTTTSTCELSSKSGHNWHYRSQTLPDFELLERPFEFVEGHPTHCVLCDIMGISYYLHKVTKSPYCLLCAEAVTKGEAVAK